MTNRHLDDLLDDEGVRRVRELLADRPDAVVSLLDADGRMLWLSEPGSRGMFGRTPDAVEGQTALDYIHPDDRHRTRDHYAKALAGDTVRWSARALDAEGRWRAVTTVAWGVGPDVMVAISTASVDDDVPAGSQR